MLVKLNMMHDMKKNLKNTIKKKIGLFLLLDEMLEKKTESMYTKHIKKTTNYLMNILYTENILVHTIKMIKLSIDI